MYYLLLCVPAHSAMLWVHRDTTQEKYLSAATCLVPDLLFAAQQVLIVSYQPTKQNKMEWTDNTKGGQHMASERSLLILKCTLQTLQTP